MIVVVSQDGQVNFPVQTSFNATRFQVSLTGVDGSVWDLTNGDVLLAPGGELFAAPDTSHWWKDSPVVDGSRYGGSRTPRQDRAVPVMVLGDDWQSWRDTDAAFFRAIHPSGECLLTVTSPDSTSRSIGLRFTAGGAVEMDPLTRFFAAYALEFTAANPFWRGDPISTVFDVADPVRLFPGPPWRINPSSATTGGTLTNPGDEPVWPRYTVVGPADSWSVGVGAARISSDTPLAAGQAVYIDTDRTQLTVVDESGVNVYGNLDNDTFAPIPAGSAAKMELSIAGYGAPSQIVVEFTPLYRRAW